MRQIACFASEIEAIVAKVQEERRIDAAFVYERREDESGRG